MDIGTGPETPGANLLRQLQAAAADLEFNFKEASWSPRARGRHLASRRLSARRMIMALRGNRRRMRKAQGRRRPAVGPFRGSNFE